MAAAVEDSPPPTGEETATPAPEGEVNAVVAGDAAEKTQSNVPGGSLTPGAKTSGKPSGPKGSRTGSTTSGSKEEGEDGDGEGGAGSDAESEYETICFTRKKPRPFIQRVKRFLSSYIAFDIYMTTVMFEAFKIVIITSQFNWALEILAGITHILISACKCAIKKECKLPSGRRSSSESTEGDESGDENESKKSSVRGSKPSGKPSSGGSVPKKSLSTPATGDGTESSPATETTDAEKAGSPEGTGQSPEEGETPAPK